MFRNARAPAGVRISSTVGDDPQNDWPTMHTSGIKGYTTPRQVNNSLDGGYRKG